MSDARTLRHGNGLWLAMLALAALLLPSLAAAQDARAPVTILISIDGFRPDYLDRGVTPRLNALKAAGASARMRPSFPTLTFPNHYTLVTGLRPDRHGIVGNRFEDPRRPGIAFTLSNTDPFWWNEAEPLWITAERAGLRTATMFWPGSEVLLSSTRARDWWTYATENREAQRVDTVIDWLRRPVVTRPQFVTLYFDTVDTIGHASGPDAPQTTAAVAAVDAQIGRLVDGLGALGQSVNLVIVADHGMTATSPERVIRLSSLLRAKDARVVVTGTYAGIEPAKGREARVSKALLRDHPNMRCYQRENLPPELHYGRNPRVSPFICLAALGWWILDERPEARAFTAKGMHGYEPSNSDMDALFIASGPAFRAGVAMPSFDNVDVYPLVAKLIGVMPREHDGSDAGFASALKP